MAQNIENELLEMKQQLRALQSKLDDATRVREDSLRRLMNAKASDFKSKDIRITIFVALAGIFVVGALAELGTSTLFIAVTAVAMVLNFAFKIYEIVRYNLWNITEGSLLEAAKRLQGYQHFNMLWLKFVAPIFILTWVPWYIIESMNALGFSLTEDPWVLTFFIAACLAGAVVGGCLGYFGMVKPQMNRASQMIGFIRELER